MKRARYNKGFKISSVKYALSVNYSIKEVSMEAWCKFRNIAPLDE